MGDRTFTTFQRRPDSTQTDFVSTVEAISARAPRASRDGQLLGGQYTATLDGAFLRVANTDPQLAERLSIEIERQYPFTFWDISNVDLVIMAMLMIHADQFEVKSRAGEAFTAEAFGLARAVKGNVEFPTHWFSDGRLMPAYYAEVTVPESSDFRA